VGEGRGGRGSEARRGTRTNDRTNEKARPPLTDHCTHSNRAPHRHPLLSTLVSSILYNLQLSVKGNTQLLKFVKCILGEVARV
jgi:hypothetical protein